MRIGIFKFNSVKKYQDPVCLMKVKIEDGAISSEYKGERYYFCSQTCKEEFDKNPEKYNIVEV